VELIKKCTDYFKKVINSALNSRWFLVIVGFLAGVFFDPVAIISGISVVGWFFIGLLASLLGYIFYAYHKINQDSFKEF